ncbi:arylsulfatase [Streptomyces sp. NBC_00158]
MNRLTLLHTSPVHVPVFDALAERDHPGVALRHVVRPGLLEQARAVGAEGVRGEVREVLAGVGGPVLVTCSTIGGVAESLQRELGFPVLRVDRAMAARAVGTGPRVVVLAALESTLGPSAELLAEEGAEEVRGLVVPGAWEMFEAGDEGAYLRAVARAADRVTGADVIVLAQASMAGAVGLVRTRIPVLGSPALGLAAAVAEGRTG